MAPKSVIGFLIIFVGLLGEANAIAKIDPSLTQKFLFGGDGGGEKENVMVSFTEGIHTVLDRINEMNFPSMAEKREALMTAQKTLADNIQGSLKRVLISMGIPFESFWINNMMIVPNVDSRIVSIISRVPGVAKVEPEPVVSIEPIEEEGEEILFDANVTRTQRQTNQENQWGIDRVRAPEVWNTLNYTGKGVVIAGIDTGVRHTHTLIKHQWRSNYGWYDPYRRTSLPRDDGGHGTHTTTTMVGKNGFGVAPDAKWIACKGCTDRTCGTSQLLKCGQWVLCPTKTDGTQRNCGMAPDIVSSSWGGNGGNRWYEDVIRSWRSAGIIPVFSGGNRGPGCSTTSSPGDSLNAINVGSIDENGRISSFSSFGPARDGSGRIKPDFTAPGGKILSAGYTNDYVLSRKSGTSMACPHVTGVIALMKEKNPSLVDTRAYEVLRKTAVKTMVATKTCGGVGRTTFPNNVYGHGLVDAFEAVKAA